MNFIYSTDVIEIAAQIESAQINLKTSKRDRTITELLAFVAYVRTDKAGFDTDQGYAKAIGVPKSDVSKALTVLELGLPQVVARNGRGFATPDESIVETVVAFVDAHNGKALSGIYSALTSDSETKVWNMVGAVATLLATATKREIALTDVLAEVMSQVETLLGTNDESSEES